MNFIDFTSSLKIIPKELTKFRQGRESMLRSILGVSPACALPFDLINTYSSFPAIEQHLTTVMCTSLEKLDETYLEYAFLLTTMFSIYQLDFRTSSDRQLHTSEYTFIVTKQVTKSLLRLVKSVANKSLCVDILRDTSHIDAGFLSAFEPELTSLIKQMSLQPASQLLTSTTISHTDVIPNLIFRYKQLDSNEFDTSEFKFELFENHIGLVVLYKLGVASECIEQLKRLNRAMSFQGWVIVFDHINCAEQIIKRIFELGRWESILIKSLSYDDAISGSRSDCLLLLSRSIFPDRFRRDMQY